MKGRNTWIRNQLIIAALAGLAYWLFPRDWWWIVILAAFALLFEEQATLKRRVESLEHQLAEKNDDLRKLGEELADTNADVFTVLSRHGIKTKRAP